jgi:outer membrane lipoprotein-sorting protein
MSFEQWTDGDKMRMEYVDGAEELKGTVMVVNGNSMAMYMPSTNQFMETELPDLQSAGAAQTAAMTRQWVDEILKTNTITLGGIEEVAGRRTYQLNATPKSDAGAAAEDAGGSTLWVDAETFYPLKLDMTVGPMHMTMTTREVEYNPVVPADNFVLEPPPGAETSDLGLGMPDIETTTAQDAQAQVDFDILEADSDATDFLLENTSVAAMPGSEEGGFSAVTQTYTGPNGTLSVMQMPAVGDFDIAGAMGGEGGAKTVDVSGTEASLVSLGVAGNMLSWRVGDTQITVSGMVGEEDMLRFAESLH